MSRGLLTHLADRFVTQREDLATEALLFILEASASARAEMVRMLVDMGCQLAGDPVFRSQAVGEEFERPDLCCAIDGEERALFEAKFWAGLTDNQPCGYLRRGENGRLEALVFILPERRLELVWSELERRVRHEGWTLEARESPFPGSIVAQLDGTRLAAVTWTSMLARLERTLVAGGERELLESLGQLQDLCEREDRNAFLPIHGEELTTDFPRRIVQFCSLADDIAARLVAKGVGDMSRLRASAGAGWYGRYIRLHGLGCLVQVNAENWATYEATPLWLRISNSKFRVSKDLHVAMVRGRDQGLFGWYEAATGFDVPLHMPTGKDRSEVLDKAVRDILVVLDFLVDAGATAGAASDLDAPGPEDL